MDQDKQIENLKRYIASAEESLEAAKKALSELTGQEYSSTGPKTDKSKFANLRVLESGTVIEGIFDGENMVGPEEKVYPVPANYASKSKLIEGDKLKLTIAEDGSFIFKQIGPIERKKIVGVLNFENNAYHVLAEGKSYNVLYASVSYFKAKPGDRVTIVTPGHGESKWAALENIIHDVEPSEPIEEKIELDQEKDRDLISQFFADEPAATEQPVEEVAKELVVETAPVPEAPKEEKPEITTSLSDLPDFPEIDSEEPVAPADVPSDVNTLATAESVKQEAAPVEAPIVTEPVVENPFTIDQPATATTEPVTPAINPEPVVQQVEPAPAGNFFDQMDSGINANATPAMSGATVDEDISEAKEMDI